jgi:hypothetical protein
MVTNVSTELSASIFRLKKWKIELLEQENEDNTVLQTVGNYIYQPTRRNNSEDWKLQQHRCEKLKFRKI